MTTPVEGAIIAARATQTGYPLAKKIWKHFRTIRGTLAIPIFWEARRAGLLASYKDRDDALPDIVQAVMESATIRILSNKGDDWLGEHGRLSPAIRLLRGSEKKPKIQTLLMHLEAPWINDYHGGYRGKDLLRVRDDFAQGHRSVLAFCRDLGLTTPRFHKLAATWRFVMTDDDVFVSTYDNIDRISNVQVDRFSSKSIVYKTLRTQFDFTYDVAASEPGELTMFERLSNKRVEFKESAGLVCTRIEGGVRRVLVLEKDQMIVLPKGGIEMDEIAVEGASREFREETGFDLDPANARFVGAYVTGQHSSHPSMSKRSHTSTRTNQC